MKAKWITCLVEIVVLIMILFMAHRPVVAASAEEIKLVQPSWGSGVPLPAMELGQALDWLKLLYDPLVGTTPDGKLSAEHGLATKWEMSPDGLTWTFYLRKGVKFHDGVELTAKDVKFSLEQVMLPDSLSALSEELRKYVRVIEIKDPYTLLIHCKKPATFLSSNLTELEYAATFIIPKDYYERVGKDQFMKKPIGTGPYKWHSQVVGSSIKLEAFGRHWRDGVPRYKYVSFLNVPEENTRIAMLKTGEADITRISRGSMKEVRGAGLNVISKKDSAAIGFFFLMQWATPAFSDIRFRKALNLAIDREAIIKNILEGGGVPIAGYPGHNIFACGGDPNLKPYPYDPQEARRLIKEGQYEGYEFSVSSFPRDGLPEFQQIIEALVGYWQKIGLKPKIFMTEWTTFRSSWRARKVQNFVCGYEEMTNPECFSMLSTLEQKYVSTEARATVQDPKMDEWFKRASSTLDAAEVARILGQVYRYSHDQYLTIPVSMMNDEIAFTKRIPEWNPGRRRADRNYNDIIRQR